MFKIKNVTKQYGDEFALNSVSMQIGKGLNFLIGASGSGKTTLLKIISGMEPDFDGEVSYCGKDMKTLSSQEKSYFYNNVFGFIWQDFNLLEEATVFENVLLPAYLKNGKKEKDAIHTLQELKIADLRNQKVKNLSGGQKQRVAIARELMKNPQVILADEPTSALDPKTAKATMKILRSLAKSRTVIVVTHDTALISAEDKVYELDKGELISADEPAPVKSALAESQPPHLPISSAFSIAGVNTKNQIGRFLISVLTLTLAGVLLLVTLSGAIQSGGEGAFQKLFDTYGDSLLDLSIVGSFMDAGGAGGESEKKPNGDVKQNIGGLYEKYKNDPRVKHIVSLQAYDDIKINFNSKSYSVQKTGNSPVFQKLVAGKLPSDDSFQVVVPQGFVKTLGISNEDAVGKELQFSASIFNWDSGEPVAKPVQVKAIISGVADNTAYYDYEGKTTSFSVDDSFLFGKTAEDDMRRQAGTANGSRNFSMRAATPEDLIALKDELNKNGIVPIGQFELVEDMVRLKSQTAAQSGSANLVIGFLAIVLTAAVSLTTALLRRKEYAIYKISGFTNGQLCKTAAAEFVLSGAGAILLLLITSPLLNLVTKALFGVELLSFSMLTTGVLLVMAVAAFSFIITLPAFINVKIAAALKAGDKT